MRRLKDNINNAARLYDSTVYAAGGVATLIGYGGGYAVERILSKAGVKTKLAHGIGTAVKLGVPIGLIVVYEIAANKASTQNGGALWKRFDQLYVSMNNYNYEYED